MTARVCRTCGAIYDGSPYSRVCPDCKAAGRSKQRYARVCAVCGAAFLSDAPRTRYCSACAPEVRRRQHIVNNQRQKAGSTRKLGSVDLCAVCGQPYTVVSGMQRYCPACREAAVKAAISRGKRAYRAVNRQRITVARKHARRKGLRQCNLCGATFDPHGKPTRYCSTACKRAVKNAAWTARARQKGK